MSFRAKLSGRETTNTFHFPAFNHMIHCHTLRNNSLHHLFWFLQCFGLSHLDIKYAYLGPRCTGFEELFKSKSF